MNLVKHYLFIHVYICSILAKHQILLFRSIYPITTKMEFNDQPSCDSPAGHLIRLSANEYLTTFRSLVWPHGPTPLALQDTWTVHTMWRYSDLKVVLYYLLRCRINSSPEPFNPNKPSRLSHPYHLDGSTFFYRSIRSNFSFYFIFRWKLCK